MQPNHKKYVGDAIALGAAGLLSFVVLVNRAPRIEASVTPRPIVSPADLSDTNDEVATVLRHPLIEGGIISLSALRARLSTDEGLRHFYEQNGLDLECLSEKTLDRSEWARVSYRQGSSFSWSRRPLLLLAGEKVFEDCHGHAVRAQCGNLVATIRYADEFATTELPGPGLEPTGPIAELASPSPESGPAPDVNTPFIPQPAPPVPSGPAPVAGVPCCAIGGGGVPPIATPEPGILPLLLTAIVCLVCPLYKFPRKEEENDGHE